MAKLFELRKGWEKKYPPKYRRMAKRMPPNLLYKIKETGQRGYIVSYGADGTVTLALTAEFNLLAFERDVFGIAPDEVEECSLPLPGEPLGTLPSEQALEILNVLRAQNGLEPFATFDDFANRRN